MNNQQYERMKSGRGFLAALDQSGGSTPKTLALYGVKEGDYKNEKEMFDQVHEMRSRIIVSPSFNSEYILGAILFEDTMNRKVKDVDSTDYLWNKKGIVPFLKIDKGLAELNQGVQIMKPIPNLDNLLKEALSKNIFGTKMRSFIQEANQSGIKEVVEQQFDLAKQIFAAGLIPIIEPEIDIDSPQKAEAEQILKIEISRQLAKLPKDYKVMIKVSLPKQNNFYESLMSNEHIVRIVALSGGYTPKEANLRLSENHGLIASFSRTLLTGLNVNQSDEEFNMTLKKSIQAIYNASIS